MNASSVAVMTPASVVLDQINAIPLFQILPGDNDRTAFGEAELEELGASIKKDGLHEPVIVRPWGWRCRECGEHRHRPFDHEHAGKTYAALTCYQLVAGERRFKASQLVGLPTIKAIVRKMSDEAADGVMLAENLQRADLDPLDEAHAYQKRMDRYGWTINQLSEKTKKNPKHISARLLLLELLPDVQDLIRKGQVSVSFGEVMAALDSNRQRIALQYLTTSERPVLKEFKILVGQLLAEQASQTMFDMDALKAEEMIQNAVDERNANRGAAYRRRFPVAEGLPPMHRAGGIGESFEAYLKELQGLDGLKAKEALPIIGFVYDQMLRLGMCFPPNPAKDKAKAERGKEGKREKAKK